MQRAPQLIQLSREHHGALRLALQLRLDPAQPVPAQVVDKLLKERPQLLEHFAAEERDLLPQLHAFGESRLAQRLLDEHREMRALCQQPFEVARLARFGSLLQAHVRFEERELFAVLQQHWGKTSPDCRQGAAAELFSG